MPSIDQIFQSNWFNHSDIGDVGAERTYQIESVTPGEIRDKKSGTVKPSLNIQLVGVQKTWGCNKTNAKRIATLYGHDYSHWAGQVITLVHTTVDFSGNEVSAVRVKPGRPQANRMPTPPHINTAGVVNRQRARQEPPPQQRYDGPNEEDDFDPLG